MATSGRTLFLIGALLVVLNLVWFVIESVVRQAGFSIEPTLHWARLSLLLVGGVLFFTGWGLIVVWKRRQKQ